jgi:hypothetical protein
MNTSSILRRSFGAGALSAALFASPHAQAVTLQVVPFPIYQIADTGQVSFGHTVVASTSMNRLTASGSYNISCNRSETQPLVGQRTLSDSKVIGGITLYVTVPESVPATRSLPGFTSVPRGTDMTCTYEWTARAVEGTYSIGGGGIGIVIGGEERADGNTSTFHMIRELVDRNGCIRD